MYKYIFIFAEAISALLYMTMIKYLLILLVIISPVVIQVFCYDIWHILGWLIVIGVCLLRILLENKYGK